MNSFKAYNIYNINQININDAVKVTSQPQNESFWVQVESINRRTKVIRGSVQNILQREHNYNVNDMISFKAFNIKEHKLERERFNLANLSSEELTRLRVAAILGLNLNEFEEFINTRNI